MNYIGNNCKIDPTATFGDNVCIGDNTIIRENVVVGNNVTICENCVIGETPTVWDVKDAESDIFKKKLIIKDNVTIRCNTIIERGGLTDATIIDEGSMVGSFCYIGHDANIGKCCTIFPYVFFCGSVTLKDEVMVYSHSTIFNNVVLGDKTIVFHGTNVFNSTDKYGKVFGQYGDTLKEYCKKRNFLKHSSNFLQRIKNLEDTINGKDRREYKEEIQQS